MQDKEYLSVIIAAAGSVTLVALKLYLALTVEEDASLWVAEIYTVTLNIQ